VKDEIDACSLTENDHCVTCSDEALEARVLRIDQASGMALVAVENATAEVDVSLVEEITPGDLLLIHGGVAIAKL
jgi:hydrogenase maturation factor